MQSNEALRFIFNKLSDRPVSGSAQKRFTVAGAAVDL